MQRKAIEVIEELMEGRDHTRRAQTFARDVICAVNDTAMMSKRQVGTLSDYLKFIRGGSRFRRKYWQQVFDLARWINSCR